MVVAPETAHADPACVNKGAYILFARGSTAPLDSDPARDFRETVERELNGYGVSHAWAELGNLDNDYRTDADGRHFPNSSYEYPASPFGSSYESSVATGVKELVANLNHRYETKSGDWVSGCRDEVAILGGYSQGAQVVGQALNSAELGSDARRHIAAVALYGDTKYACDTNRWSAIDCNFLSQGIMGARLPYISSDLVGRAMSWCDPGDGFCNGGPNPGNHGSIYHGKWIGLSGRWIGLKTVIRLGDLGINKWSYAELRFGYLQQLQTLQLPSNPPPPPRIKSLKRAKDPDGTNQVYAATNSAVTEGWWKYGGDGVHTKEIIHISQDNIVGFDKTNLPEGKQAVFTAVPDGIWETVWDPQHDPKSAKIITGLTGVRQVIADNRWEGANRDQYVHRLYVLADQGPYEFWWKDGEVDSSGNTIIHKNLLDSITGGITMTSSTAPDGSYELYVATPTWVYELKWNPGADFHHRPMINITQGDINSLSKVTVGSEERLFTGTSTGTWQGKWVGNGSPANNPEVNGKVGIISSQGMYTGNAFQIYLLTASGVTEFWYTPTNAGNGPVLNRPQGDLTAFTKFNDGAAQQVYTGTVNGEVLETYWGGGAGLTTKKLYNVNR